MKFSRSTEETRAAIAASFESRPPVTCTPTSKDTPHVIQFTTNHGTPVTIVNHAIIDYKGEVEKLLDQMVPIGADAAADLQGWFDASS